MTPELTEAGVAAWLFELETAWRLKGEVRPARAVLALVEAKVREAVEYCSRWRMDTEEGRVAHIEAIVSRVMKGTT